MMAGAREIAARFSSCDRALYAVRDFSDDKPFATNPVELR